MEHGLVATTTTTSAGEPGEFQGTTSGGGGVPAYSSTSAGGPSHLDSFIEGSNWSREDLVTVATVLNTVLFVTLVYYEVYR